MKFALAVFFLLALSACATSPETYQRRIASLSNAELCFLDAAGDPNDALYTKPEIQQRNLVCTPQLVQIGFQLAQTKIAERQARAAALSNLGQALSKMGAPSGSPSQSTQGISAGVTCFHRRDVISGLNKICYYDCLGSAHAVTIGAAELCPITTTR